MVAKLICQAKVDGVHCGPNAFKAELAIGFQARKMELCKKANIQNSLKRIHFLKPKKWNKILSKWKFFQILFYLKIWKSFPIKAPSLTFCTFVNFACHKNDDILVFLFHWHFKERLRVFSSFVFIWCYSYQKSFETSHELFLKMPKE